MARFNTAPSTNKTTNLAGGEAFSQSPKLELASILLTSMVQDQYYRGANDTVDRVVELLPKLGDEKFGAKAAVYARNEFGMRSISHVVAGEIAKLVKGKEWTKDFYDKVVRRPDDITEILSYYLNKYEKPIPNSLKKGLGQAFGKFDEYQLAKYRSEGKGLSLVDVVNLVHPPHSELIAKLVDGKLKTTGKTWESKLSEAGKGEDADSAKAKAWSDLIKERKIGYFALLRNLRNILEQNPEIVDEACQMLRDPKLIKKSLVLPFRFFTAYHELGQVAESSKVLGAISDALEVSFANVPKLDGKTLVVVDHSGSMGEGYGSEFMKGALFGVAMAKANDSDFMHFGNTAEYLSFNPNDSTLTLTEYLDGLNDGWGNERGKGYVGHGTNFHAIFDEANKVYDRIVIFSDMQGWIGYYHPGSALQNYMTRCGVKNRPHIYSIDLSGYGTMQFPEQNVYCLAGFSEKIFDIMKLLEKDRKALISEIEKVEL